MSDDRSRWTRDDIALAMRQLSTSDELAAARWLTERRDAWLSDLLG